MIIPAPAVTTTSTPTAATTSTMTSTIVAQPTVTIVQSYYSVCDPKVGYNLEYWSTNNAPMSLQGSTPDALTCCQNVAAVPGAVACAHCATRSASSGCGGSNVNACYGIVVSDTTRCAAGNPQTIFGYARGPGEFGGTLQCGSGSLQY